MTSPAPSSLPEQPAPLEDQLIRQFKPMAFAIARQFYFRGCDTDDVRQEALVAVLLGVRAHRPELGVPLQRFVEIVVRRRLVTMLKHHQTIKHTLITDATRRTRLPDDTEIDAIDLATAGDMEELLEAREELRRIRARLRFLSPLERESLAHVLNGGSYKGNKTVDNALVRARRKLAA